MTRMRRLIGTSVTDGNLSVGLPKRLRAALSRLSGHFGVVRLGVKSNFPSSQSSSGSGQCRRPMPTASLPITSLPRHRKNSGSEFSQSLAYPWWFSTSGCCSPF